MTSTAIPVAAGSGALNDYFNWSNIVAGNRYNLFGLSGQYDPFYTGQAQQPGTFQPTLANQQRMDQNTQWGAQNALQSQQNATAARSLDAQIAQWASQNQLNESTLTGFYNGLPTLAREQLAATIGIANADNFRQWAQMRGNQLLQQQAQDDAMRVAGGQARLGTLNLLAGQRGPQNFLAYNYLQNALGSPDLKATDPFGIASRIEAGVAPRSEVNLQSAWNTPVPGGGVAMPAMTAPAGGATSAGGGAAGGSGGGVNASSPAAAPVHYTAPPSSTGLAVSGNPAADAALLTAPASAAGPGWANADPATLAELRRISGGMATAYQTQQQNTGGMAGYAAGTGSPVTSRGFSTLPDPTPRLSALHLPPMPGGSWSPAVPPMATKGGGGGGAPPVSGGAPLDSVDTPLDSGGAAGNMPPDTADPTNAAGDVLPTVKAGDIDWKQYLTDFQPRTDKVFMAGEDPSDKPNPEVFLNLDGGRFVIIPVRKMAPADQAKLQDTAVGGGSTPGYAEGTGWNMDDWTSWFGRLGQHDQQQGQQQQQWPQDGQQGQQDDWGPLAGAMAAWMQQRGHGGGWGEDMGGGWGGNTGGAHILPVPPSGGGGAPAGGNQSVTGPAGHSAWEPNGSRVSLPWGDTYVNPADSYWGGKAGYQQGSGDIPRFAAGTDPFSTNTPFGNFGTFTPQQLAGAPVVQQLTGQRPVNQWQHYGGADTMTLPGTDTQLPGTFNVTNYLKMAPSARYMTQGLYETPRLMGGLGLDWNDILQASQRSAPVGARVGMPGYGFR